MTFSLLYVNSTVEAAFNSNFWLATGAAAPVIAAAVAVLLPTVAGAFRMSVKRFFRAKLINKPLDRRDVRNAWGLMLWTSFICFINVANAIAQAILTIVSLSAIAYGRAIMPPWIAIYFAAGGIAILCFSLMTAPTLRKRRRQGTDGGLASSDEPW